MRIVPQYQVQNAIVVNVSFVVRVSALSVAILCERELERERGEREREGGREREVLLTIKK